LIRCPPHARWLWRKLVFLLCLASPHGVKALRDFLGTARCALRRVFSLRCVPQVVAEPAPEITAPIDLPASPIASRAPEPLPPHQS
jgi:hypothetical protein